MAPPRILLCGDVLGRLNQLFKRVQSVNRSAGPFVALLCVGQFFPESSERLEELLDNVEGIGDYGVGAAEVLIAASKDSANQGFKMDGLKVADNLFWLKAAASSLSTDYLGDRLVSSLEHTIKMMLMPCEH